MTEATIETLLTLQTMVKLLAFKALKSLCMPVPDILIVLLHLERFMLIVNGFYSAILSDDTKDQNPNVTTLSPGTKRDALVSSYLFLTP